MTREVAVVIAQDGTPLYWHVPPDASGAAIPDSQDLWAVIWSNRDRILGVAHTHPWDGKAWPSTTDLTTFDAIERALGRGLTWWVVTFTEVRKLTRTGSGSAAAPPRRRSPARWRSRSTTTSGPDMPPWVARLRALSRNQQEEVQNG